MKHVIMGTAGHVDHGKTCLIKALTGTDTDRLKEEKQRGITIELGFARLSGAEDLEIGIVDVPGHEKFVRHMLAGASGIDMVLFVIAADEGMMPQTVDQNRSGSRGMAGNGERGCTGIYEGNVSGKCGVDRGIFANRISD